ncbi:MAG: hypothetical protein ACMXYF_00655 [Candidatus Woesearchaeota archaeon]
MSIYIIQELAKQGLNSLQITQTLQRDGASLSQISSDFELYSIAKEVQKMDMQNPMGLQPQGISGMPPPPGAQMPQQQGVDEAEEIEQLIEAIIHEKWNDIQKDLTKLYTWKDNTEQRLAKFDQEFKDLKEEYNNLQKAVIGKVGDYDKNVLAVGSQLQAMEKAFSKILPTFTENIQELNRITDKFKKEE